MKKNFIIIANAALGKGFSGSDRIFVELAKNLNSAVKVTVCVWEEGFEMCKRQGLNDVNFERWYLGRFKSLPFLINYFFRIISGIYYSLIFNPKNTKQEDLYFYSASDFWQDFIPFLIFKIRFPKAQFIGSFYLAAPNPLIGFRKEYESSFQIPKIKDILYFLQQYLPKLLLSRVCNYIFVTSDPDKERFIKQGFKKENLFSIMGGVNFSNYEGIPENTEKIYEAVFYGRFHPQKGVLELLDIWKLLLKKIPEARLIMIGSGPLFLEVEKRIKENNLSNNIFLKGHMDDSEEKFKLFAQSKVVVHPAVYDSGGMASAEVMFLKIPGVSFDLEALKTYYPKGMLKTKCFDLEAFATNIYKLLTNKDFYSKEAAAAKECVLLNFDWNKKALYIKEKIFEI